MDLRMLGARWMFINVLRRSLVREKTAGYELHHGQLPLLETILAFPGSTQQELAERIRVTPASVAQSVARLEKAGLIEKQTDPDNRRRNRIRGTAAGAEAARLYRESFDEADARMFSGMSEAELCTLYAYLDRIIANLNGNAEALPPCPFWKGEPPK